MPRILPLYVLREVMKMYPLMLSLGFILQVVDILSVTVGKAIDFKMSFSQAVVVFLAILPQIMTRALILGIPFAILLAFARLQSDSETKAMWAAGIKPLQIILPLLLPFAIVGGLVFWNEGFIAPAGNQRWDHTWRVVLGASTIRKKSKYTYAPAGALYYAGEVAPEAEAHKARLAGVMVQRGTEIMTAQMGEWDAQAKTWTLEAPWITRSGQTPYQESQPQVVPQNDVLTTPPPEAKQISNREIEEVLKNARLSKEERRTYEYTLSARYANPLIAVIFALAVGGVGFLIRDRTVAFAVGVGFVGIFYGVWITMPQLAKSGAMDPQLAAWFPNIIFLIFAIVINWRLR